MHESFSESPSVTMTSKHLFSPAASQQFCVVLISNFQKSSFFVTPSLLIVFQTLTVSRGRKFYFVCLVLKICNLLQ